MSKKTIDKLISFPIKFSSVSPNQAKEGDLITLVGSGFSKQTIYVWLVDKSQKNQYGKFKYGVLWVGASTNDSLLQFSLKIPLCSNAVQFLQNNCTNWEDFTPGKYTIEIRGGSLPEPSLPFEILAPNNTAQLINRQPATPLDDGKEYWETYHNEKYGFEFRYPADHTPYVDFDSKLNTLNPADSQSNFVVIAENESQVFCCEPSTLAISGVELNSKQLNLPNAKQITFKGYSAVEIIGDGNLSSIYKKIIINKDRYTITIIQNAKSDFFNNILSTFKFTNSTKATTD